MIRIGVESGWIMLYLIIIHFYRSPLLFAIASDDSRVQDCVRLIKGEKKSFFCFVNNGYLGRKPYVWLMLIEKSLKG